MTRIRIPIAIASAALLLGTTGCAQPTECTQADLAPLARAPAYAVITSDYVASAVALLDADGNPITEAWVDSGTTRPGLTTAVSGDVALPSAAIFADTLTWIDRGQSSLTRVSVPDGAVRDQTSVVLPMAAGETAFYGNPQDAVADGANAAWVSRLEPNLDPAAAPLDRGNDLVRVDLAAGTLTDRIGLDGLDTTVMRDGSPVRIVARPTQMAHAGPRLVVGLARLSVDFQTAGPGAVAVVDLDAGSASALPLDGLVDCDHVAKVTGDPSRVLVGCWGVPFADAATQVTGAGIAVVHVAGDGTATVERLWRDADHPEAPAVTHGALSLGGTRVLAVAVGDPDTGTGDRLVLMDLTTAEARVVLDTDAPFALGGGAHDAGRGLVLWTDATAGIHRLTIDGNDVAPTDVVDPSPCRTLPPREITPVN